MRPQLTSPEAHGFGSPTSSISSSSSASYRRLSALARHLGDSSSTIMASNDTVSPSPTSASDANSVFAHIVRGPEDPILGVLSLSFSLLWLLRILRENDNLIP